METEIRKMFIDQLKDIYSAEKQGLRLMQRSVRKVSNVMLKEGMTMHVEQTQAQIERVEQALEEVGARPGRKVCEAMRGLAEEATHEMEEYEKGPMLDLAVIASQQRIEHYEISAYGTAVAFAKALGETKVGDLLAQTLEEEKQTDLKLTEVTQTAVLPEAMGGEVAANDTKASGRRSAS